MEEPSPQNLETSPQSLAASLEALEVSPKPKKSRAPLVFGLIGAFLLALFVIVFLNYTVIKDYFVGLSYSPSAEMSEIKEKLGLTSSADLIFKASFPVLEEDETFNRDCDSHDSDISVLGCFSGDKIYVYNIKSPELSGILESTTAHELLHAIWSRLSGSEKAKLTPVLEDVYAKNEAALKETLESYEASDRLDELYVRIGTQIRDLPADLSAHYAKYFNDRLAVVSFYESYIAPFNELKEKIASLGRELEASKAEIDSETADYESRLEVFNAAVGKFNACATTENCFTQSAFYARLSELTAEEKELDLVFEKLNLKIDEYNFKVEEYNKNILKSNSLQNIINSNSAPSELNE